MRKRFLTLILLLFAAVSTYAADFAGVRALAARRVPWLEKSLILQQIAGEKGKEIFELSTSGNKLIIKASTASAAAEGLNWYLKYYCNRSMSHMGDNLSPVSPLPQIAAPVQIFTEMPVRYALNYCTISYTMSFYSWADWQHELDWMALNGVNVMLATVGTEAIWQRTLQRLGYTPEEARAFVAGPGFTAWWLMGNLEGWGGPVSQQMINQQEELQHKILGRMKELGIAPVLQGFYGMIPVNMKEKLHLDKVVPQGKWAGGFQRPDFLLPQDSQYAKIAGIYYDEMKRTYGKDIQYLAGDPFHEGGNAKGLDVTAAAKGIQEAMQEAFPGVTWVLQGWQANPKTALLAGLDKSKVLVQELFGENTANWESRKGYEQTPFIWCTVTNFGEKLGLYGKLQRYADEVYRASTGPYKHLMRGAGIMPEGIHNNPVIYQLVLELPWHQEHVVVKDWITAYVRSRYGSENTHVEEAWQQFVATCYSSFDKYQEGPTESIFTARPTTDTTRPVSTWGTRHRNYDTAAFRQGVAQFLAVGPAMKRSETYQIDAIDFQRQVNSNRGEYLYTQMITAWKNSDAPALHDYANLFLQQMQQQDSLLSTNKHFRLDTWLNSAMAMGSTSAEKKQLKRNAKVQLTYWGPDNPDTDLHEYANKEWGGLMKELYIPRWKLFTDDLFHSKERASHPVNFFQFEKEWTEK
ncbi:alpha-N-acetylglucosaminidase [Chitinophaga dinghuensis]|nr:alpha-N-acetylglucosaminidase [Chitinophaga dinghuensis]